MFFDMNMSGRHDSDSDFNDLEERPPSSRKRSIDPDTGFGLSKSELMSTSSSDDLREEFGNGELPFDMELSGLNINGNESPSAPIRAEDSRKWAQSQGLTGRYARMLSKVTSFDLVPESGKLVVLDVALSVQCAFQALRENGIKSAPLWDSEERQFVGMISVSDFVEILVRCYSDAMRGELQSPAAAATPVVPDAAECNAFVHNQLQRPLSYWREELRSVPHLIFVTPEDSAVECSHVMLQQDVHRVAILDAESNTVLFLLTHTVILNYFLAATTPNSRAMLFGRTLQETGLLNDERVGGPVSCCTLNTPFIEVLRFFSVDKCSAVPLVDQYGKMIAVATKSDIRGLVKPGIWGSLNESVGELLRRRYRGQLGPDISERILTPESTLEDAMEKLRMRDVYRLFVLDDSQRVIGRLTLTRLMRYILSVR